MKNEREENFLFLVYDNFIISSLHIGIKHIKKG